MSQERRESTSTSDVPVTAWNPYSAAGVLRMYLLLLPLSALGVAYLLLSDRFTAVSQAALAHASYGRPFPWVTQDLSRYGAGEFPLLVDFNWQRNWSEPIATDVDWLAFVADTAIVGIGVTAALYLLIPVLRRALRSRGRSA